MAIIVEEEQREKKSPVNAIVWLAILAVIVGSIYYIFFKKPELIEFKGPINFKNTMELSKIDLNPNEAINNPLFQLLKQYIKLSPPQNIGRANPFLSF